MSEPNDSRQSDAEIKSDDGSGAAYGPYDPTRDYMSEFKRVYDELQSTTLRYRGQAHTGINPASIGAWTEALEDNLSESELLAAIEAAKKTRQELQDCEDAINSIFDADGLREELAKYEVLDEQDKQNKIVEMLKDFLQDAPQAIPDLQADGFDFGAASRVAVDTAAQAVRNMAAQCDELRRRQSKFVDALSTVSVALSAINNRMAQLKETARQRSEQLDSLRQEFDTASSERDSWRAKSLTETKLHAGAEGKVQQLEQQLRLLKNELGLVQVHSDLEAALRQNAESARDQYQDQLQDNADSLASLTKERDSAIQLQHQAEQDRDQHLRELSASKISTNQLTNVKQKLENDIDDLQRRLASQIQQLGLAHRQRKDASDQLADALGTYDAQSFELQEIEDERKIASENWTTLQRKYDLQSIELDQLRNTAAEQLKDALEKAESSRKTLELKIASTRAKLEHSRDEHTKLMLANNKTIRDMQTGRRALHEEKEKLLFRSQRLEAEGHEQRVRLDVATNELKDHRDKLTDVTRQLSAVTEEFNASKNQLDQAFNQLTIGENQRAETSAQLAASEERLTGTLDQLATEHAELSTAQSDLAMVQDQLRISNDMYRDQQVILEGTVAECKDAKMIAEQNANHIQMYESMFLRLFMRSDKQIDFAKFRDSWETVRDCLESFRVVVSPSAISQIYGLTSGNDGATSGTDLGLRALLDAQTDSGATIADVYQINDALVPCDDRDRIAVLAMTYALVVRTLDSTELSLERSLVFLRVIETLLRWVDRSCEQIASLSGLMISVNRRLYTSSIIVSAMAAIVACQLNGVQIDLVDALRGEGTNRRCQYVLDGHAIIREAGRGLIVITPSRDVVFVPLSKVSLERYDPRRPGAEVFTLHYERIVFHECPLLGPWKTSWWTLSQDMDMMPVIKDLRDPTRTQVGGSSSAAGGQIG